ncbi:GUN4 domain-containing protein [Mastigocoleus sp. MO_188.B34]|uniref:GUN4 domain-containing protein n=1 Tax=Mastigocoleus sp. MO_188.B34 TaxID=3036635 RepID=UPI0026282494|nr:GUN4 domain-containing protein [Mastigocoleus sp. MO_188.B34]MDJ0692838.1 GUN4 domain-containing protein [Mastigocoleus sp. MO_188.B34]
MTDPMILSGSLNDIEALRSQLIAGSEKVQQQTISELAELQSAGLDILMEFLLQRRENPSTWIDGKAYTALYNCNLPAVQEFLQTNFPQGVIPLTSEREINYAPLQKLLASQDFQAADQMTLQKMCELAGEDAIKRKWIYFTEVESFPIADLQTINQLWLVHSEGKFGFSVQRELWLRLGKNWESLWAKIAWKNGNNWTRYPGEFIWSLDAPRAHLPLSNQLRGVRVIASLFAHPAWSTDSQK